MRRKKNHKEGRTPSVCFLLFMIAVSGLCLYFSSGIIDINGVPKELRYIEGALAGTGAEETIQNEIYETVTVSRSSEEIREENETPPGGVAAMFIRAALSDGGKEKNGSDGEGYEVISSTADVGEKPVEKPVASDIKGAVFIYHTHSTESYEPYSEGNYHITGNEGTVRNVASELEKALKSKGITVYHDTTLHDSPTYTNSYGRSLQTAKNYLAQYPDIKVIIDLHRDAMSSSGKKYPTITVDGETASSFNIVVGKENENYSLLMEFANKVIAKANELYPGLGGRIIERDYKFNQYLSDYYLLLEVGNNGNTIDETETSGRLLADVIEAVMKEI